MKTFSISEEHLIPGPKAGSPMLFGYCLSSLHKRYLELSSCVEPCASLALSLVAFCEVF